LGACIGYTPLSLAVYQRKVGGGTAFAR